MYGKTPTAQTMNAFLLFFFQDAVKHQGRKSPGQPRRALEQPARELIQWLVSEKNVFHRETNKTKTAVPEDEIPSACKPVEMYR